METIHTGSCLCGVATFQIEGQFQKFFMCHCSRCQKTSGSAHCANLFAPGAKLTWLSGKEKVSFYRHPDTNYARNFCSVCSSLLPLHVEARDIVATPAGCLDTEVGIAPQAHLFSNSKGNWDNILNDAPVFEKMPS
ncbi:GFA family protein [Marinomonas sp.]|nr:GFA family protein [Marinomonas sp.]MDB4837427.1 GFA family protein [Marinomonas sp.]